jgi:ribonuclease Z
MTIEHAVLGRPGRDNALHVSIETGQAVHDLLLDCGEGCLGELPIARIGAIEVLLFSHFHVDHIGGFDAFLRCNYARPDRPARIFGPRGTIEVIGHRLRGVTWNLVEGSPGEFDVTEIFPDRLVSVRFLTCEGFGVAHPLGERPRTGTAILEETDYVVDAMLLDHGIPSAAYRITERDRSNVDPGALARLGLRPGPWLKSVKDPAADPGETVKAGGASWTVGDLRRELLVRSPGESIAYLTDFRLDEAAEARLAEMLRGCRAIVCENNFLDPDRELADRSFHMVTSDVIRLAARVRPEALVLFHVSDRYTAEDLKGMLEQVKAEVPGARFPPSWVIENPPGTPPFASR